MIIDGKKIAETILNEVKESLSGETTPPRLSIITCDPRPETEKYLALKKRKAKEVGIEVDLVILTASATTDEIILHVRAKSEQSHGVIVQLPLPPTVDTEAILATIPPSCDVDALNPNTSNFLSPVADACREILIQEKVHLAGKKVIILGYGRLVGKPVARWFNRMGSEVIVLDNNTEDIAHFTTSGDIIVCGAGKPGVLTKAMVKEGVIVLDAGTTEVRGVLRGDANPSVGEKAAIYTPVPGGIGPITVASLLRNVALAKRKSE